MKNQSFFPTGLALALLLLTGCNHKPSTGDGKSELQPLFTEVSPGDVAVFSLKGTKTERKEDIKVTFGNQPALVVDFSKDILKVMVPNLQEGMQKVTIQAGENKLTTELSILPSRSKRLLLAYEKGQMRLINTYPSNDAFSQTPFRGNARMLSFDVMSGSGELLATGVVSDPRAGMETLSEKKQMERVTGPADVMFNVNIPNFRDTKMIRFYEVDPKVSLINEDGMKRRKLISEITL